MCRLAPAAVFVLSVILISCSATPSTIMAPTSSQSNQQAGGSLTSAQIGQGKQSAANQTTDVSVPLRGFGTQQSAGGDSTTAGVLFMVVDHGTGLFYETRSNLSLLRQNNIAITNGGDISLEARGSQGISSISIDTGFSVISMREIARNRWRADFQYLNLNNDPSLVPVLRLFINQNGQSLKQEIPIRILHDS